MGHTRALLKAFLVVMAAETARSFGFGELSVAIEAATESVTEAATQSATESVTESTTESSRAFVTYDVLSTIVDLMDAKDFSGLKTFTFSSENVRPIHRKDLNEVRYKMTTKYSKPRKVIRAYNTKIDYTDTYFVINQIYLKMMARI